MIQQMATKETKIRPEAAEVIVEAVTCDTCGAADTDSNPVNYRWSGSYGQRGIRVRPAGRVDDLHCVRERRGGALLMMTQTEWAHIGRKLIKCRSSGTGHHPGASSFTKRAARSTRR